jgi:uncharacterized phiE125 gp8 family phage protein
MGLELVTPPASEPVSLAEAKAHLRVDHDDEDAAILRLVRMARETAERITGRAFIAQEWKLWREGRPSCEERALELPKPPLIAVSAITAYDRSGTPITLSSDAYIVDSLSVPGRIVFKDTTALPVSLREANAIAVSFDAGYGANASDVPSAIRSAMLNLVGFYYEQRGNAPAQPPADILALLAPFRVIAL